jgi:hypothetical protein
MRVEQHRERVKKGVIWLSSNAKPPETLIKPPEMGRAVAVYMTLFLRFWLPQLQYTCACYNNSPVVRIRAREGTMSSEAIKAMKSSHIYTI